MLIFSKLVVATPLTTICLLMRNFIVNFVRILGICKMLFYYIIIRCK